MKRSASQSRSEDVMATAKRNKKFRLFNDPVHGHIELNEACQLIVDTKEFQRLRDIKQLGMVDFVYPGATHTRFEHALGTYHLAGHFLRSLKEYPTEVPMKKKKTDQDISDISETDILCVEIAALCHDLGCGPLSTLFSKRFLVALKKESVNAKKWLKNRNVLMFEHMLKMNCLNIKLKKFGLTETDFKFINELIGGYECNGSTAWPYEGRSEKNAFLYEIVSNHRNGVDVCKFDYMARDCHNLGIVNNFDAQRYIEFARIMEVDGEIQICTRDKELGNLYNMFFTRYNLHKFAYQHPVVCGMELMIVDALKAIRGTLEIIKVDGVEILLKMTERFMRCINERLKVDDKEKVDKDLILNSLRQFEEELGSDNNIYLLQKVKEVYKGILEKQMKKLKEDDKENVDKAKKSLESAIDWILEHNKKNDDHENIDANNLLTSLMENIKKNDDCISSVLDAIKESIIKADIKTCTWLTIDEILGFNDNNKDVALTAFTHLTDGVLFSIRNFKPDETDVELNKCVKLIERLYSRDIYKFITESSPMKQTDIEDTIKLRMPSMTEKEKGFTDEEKLQHIINKTCTNNQKISFNKDDIQIMITKLDFGMKDENPIHRLRVYKKGKLSKGLKFEQNQTSQLLEGMQYREVLVRVYTTLPNKDGRNAEKIKAIKAAFKEMWSKP